MNFDRFRVQQFLENFLGCSELENWPSYRSALEAYRIRHQDEDELRLSLLKDGEDLFYKGLLSLSEALVEISQGKHSWATVKLYYSVFYFLRSSLAAEGYAIIKNQSQYLLDIKSGSKPEKRSSKKYRNDHIGVINIYKDVVGDNDILQTNSINGKSVYEWLMEKRHQVHYRQRSFLEPEHAEFFSQAKDAIVNNYFSELLDKYYSDSIPIYCFDAEHACIAAPIKRAIFTRADLSKSGITNFSAQKISASKAMLNMCLQPDSLLWTLYLTEQS